MRQSRDGGALEHAEVEPAGEQGQSHIAPSISAKEVPAEPLAPLPQLTYEDGEAAARRGYEKEVLRLEQGHADALRESEQEAERRFTARLPRYYFTIESPLTALRVKRSDAGGPRGTRIHVSYGKSQGVKTIRESYEESWGVSLVQDPKRPDKLAYARERAWSGIDGGVLSGADFLLARLDGVLELDGRVTIRAKDDTLIDATYWGLVDLERDWVNPVLQFERPVPADVPKKGVPQEAATSPAYLAFIQGQLDGELRVHLCLRFETNTGPWASSAESEDTTWTRPSRLKHERNVWKYRELVRQQFYGAGTIRFERDPNGLTTPKGIKLDVLAPYVDRSQP